MDSLDDDAKLIGIDEEVWRKFRESKPKQEQMEFPEIVDPIDDREAFIRHKQSMAKRWFGYYKKSNQKKLRLIYQYNKIATMRFRNGRC